MKNDYLWDKTGEDPEIERLENALQAYRYKETMPPALPAKVIPFKKESPRKVFPFALATAACLAFGVIALGIWFQILRNNIEVKKDLAETTKPQIDKATSDILPDKKPDDLAVKESVIKDDSKMRKVERLKQSPPQKILKIRKTVQSPAVRLQENKPQNIKHSKPDVRLTKEEQYAYNQLMIALSFTSSKLKLVKDKVEGME
jgi:hypothetical protein